jgi:catechol 2,3-dioxygenase-like lactoylglutathione lyase family enzyme
MSGKDVHLHHFTVMAPEDVIEKVVDFYGEILGLTPGFRPDFTVPGYWLYSGDHPIIHLTVNKDRNEGTPGYFHHIALHCSNIDEVIDRLNKANVSYRRNDLDSVRLAQLIVRDPAGTPVELIFSK